MDGLRQICDTLLDLFAADIVINPVVKIEVLAGTKQMVDLFVVAIVLLVRIYVFDINVDEGEYKILSAKRFLPLAEV
jgi:hypothetical protein